MDYFKKYSEWISKNPAVAGELESVSKLLSLILPSRLPNSLLFSELFYAFSNLLTLVNNQILQRSLRAAVDRSPETKEKWRLFFSILDYTSCFFEIGAKQLWGEKGRWIVITIIQVLKAIWRLVLLVKNQTGLSETRPMKILSKVELSKSNNQPSDDFITLSCGRKIRKVSLGVKGPSPGYPPLSVPESVEPTKLKGKYFVAEALDAVKPIAYLGVAACFGANSWRPWLTSLLIDSASDILQACIRGTLGLHSLRKSWISFPERLPDIAL